MPQHLGLVSIVVHDYDEAISFYVNTLSFELVADKPVPEQNKRWVVVAPPGANESRLLLARASNSEQSARVGNQTGGRVFLFLHTDDSSATTRATSQRGSCSSADRPASRTARWRCFATSTATCGTS